MAGLTAEGRRCLVAAEEVDRRGQERWVRRAQAQLHLQPQQVRQPQVHLQLVRRLQAQLPQVQHGPSLQVQPQQVRQMHLLHV